MLTTREQMQNRIAAMKVSLEQIEAELEALDQKETREAWTALWSWVQTGNDILTRRYEVDSNQLA